MYYSKFRVKCCRGIFSRPVVKIRGVECRVIGFGDGTVLLKTWIRVKWSDATRDHLKVYFWLIRKNLYVLDCELVEVK